GHAGKMSMLVQRVLMITILLSIRDLCAQKAPSSPNSPSRTSLEKDATRQLSSESQSKWEIDNERACTLSELIDLAEQHTPETRGAWERSRSQAAQLNIAQSAYY